MSEPRLYEEAARANKTVRKRRQQFFLLLCQFRFLPAEAEKTDGEVIDESHPAEDKKLPKLCLDTRKSTVALDFIFGEQEHDGAAFWTFNPFIPAGLFGICSVTWLHNSLSSRKRALFSAYNVVDQSAEEVRENDHEHPHDFETRVRKPAADYIDQLNNPEDSGQKNKKNNK